MSWASICASARCRRPNRRSRPSGETSVAIGRIGVVGNPDTAFFGDYHDLLTAVAAGAVFPHHRLQHQRHPDREDEVVVELLTQIGADHGWLGGIDADAVSEVKVWKPRLGSAVGGDRRPREIPRRRTGFGHA